MLVYILLALQARGLPVLRIQQLCPFARHTVCHHVVHLPLTQQRFEHLAVVTSVPPSTPNFVPNHLKQMTTTAPYGTWSSPIGADLITAKVTLISEVFVDPIKQELYYSEGRPSEGGRNVLVRYRDKKELFGADYNARAGVHEYGGAASVAFNGKVYFSDWKTRRINVIQGDSVPTPVTADNNVLRYASIAVYPKDERLLVSVQEDHTKPAPSDVVNTLVAIDTSNQSITTLASGADFYSSPTFSPDGRHIAWIQWHHPDMPWEGSELIVAQVETQGATLVAKNQKVVDGMRDKVSVNEIVWTNDDTLVYQCDTSGFYNPKRYSVSTGSSSDILPAPLAFDFSEPAWIFGMSRMAYLNGNTIIASPLHQGFAKLVLIDVITGTVKYIESDYVSLSSIRQLNSASIVMSGRKDDQSPAIVKIDFSSTALDSDPSFTVLVETSSLSSTLPPGNLSASRALVLNDGQLHVLFTPPKNANYTGPEKPPAVVNIHGGPTGRVEPGLTWIAQYFTSRGWAWVDVNYSGSSGYGRAYRERLRGEWGVAEVKDAALAVKELGVRGIIDPTRATIRGGSAGGFTVLMTLCTPAIATVFAAGTSSYGVSDLKMLAEDTHKFESQYLFKLVGGTPAEVPGIYAARSAVKQADEIRAPLLILQGSDDAVVPPNQAEAIVDKIKANKGRVEYVLFEGEGHGWRKAENVKKALETECNFYERVFGLKSQ